MSGVYIKDMEIPEDGSQPLWLFPNARALAIVKSDVNIWRELEVVPIHGFGEVIIWHSRESLEMPVRHSVLVAGYMKYDFEKEYTYFVDIGVLTEDGTIETCNDWREGQQIYNIEYWAYLPSFPLIPGKRRDD